VSDGEPKPTPASAPEAAKPKEAPRDPAAEAAALAAFEADIAAEEARAKAPIPPAKADEAPPASTPVVSGGMKPLAPAPADKPPVVEFDRVTKRYGNFTAIKDVTFKIEDHPGRGEFVSILGPSGCGKSTVIRLIAGLTPQYPHSDGRMLVDGKPVTGPGADRGMVFQDYTSFDNRSVRENIAFGLECRGVGKAERFERADHWIEKVGLSVKKDADKYPHQLSGGMRQRVAIARTLILEPRIILMDEPFGALDPPTRTRMQDSLVALWREQSPTIFFITHSIEEAVFLGDHILMFSSSPGTILKELRIPPPDRPSLHMQRDPKFIEIVQGIRDVIEKLESSQRAGD
jgi:ABC-type nitrate/sulfonate/bicarbonate transport system ATPase subunit